MISEVYKRIGINIGYIRKSLNITQEELADKCELSVSYIRQIEAPNVCKAPSISALYSISKSLGVELEVLFKRVDEFNITMH